MFSYVICFSVVYLFIKSSHTPLSISSSLKKLFFGPTVSIILPAKFRPQYRPRPPGITEITRSQLGGLSKRALTKIGPGNPSKAQSKTIQASGSTKNRTMLKMPHYKYRTIRRGKHIGDNSLTIFRTFDFI